MFASGHPPRAHHRGEDLLPGGTGHRYACRNAPSRRRSRRHSSAFLLFPAHDADGACRRSLARGTETLVHRSSVVAQDRRCAYRVLLAYSSFQKRRPLRFTCIFSLTRLSGFIRSRKEARKYRLIVSRMRKRLIFSGTVPYSPDEHNVDTTQSRLSTYMVASDAKMTRRLPIPEGLHLLARTSCQPNHPNRW